ncbi:MULTISPECIES: glycerophosphodiester phosphodiesterase family protein [Micrococcaceae]|uniref:glycerophosphodiester phosphodiesterase family protein n=1 Tax=unclassified Kocuria TaxID=2649579 RepID=UPI0013EB049D|nr:MULTISPECIES: glycerophosphodiester phosphodiesterase family protein [unclassified Kocuria]
MSFLIAHRGHSEKAPENTMAAFRAAADAGFQWVETDADMLVDGTIVLIHDSSFKRTGKVATRVSESQIEDLAEIDVGRWFSPNFADTRVPTLRDLVDLMNNTGLNMNLELKLTDPSPERVDTYIHAIARELERVKPRDEEPRVIVSSFNHPLLTALHLVAPRLRLACLFERNRFTLTNRHSGWREIAHSIGATYVHPHHRELNEHIVGLIHAEGLEINTWTVNNPGRAAELAGWGVDGICTDGPKGLTPIEAPAALRHAPAARPEPHQSGSAKAHP